MASAAATPGHAAAGSARSGRLNPSVFAASRLSVTLPDGRVLVAERQAEERGPQGRVTWTGAFEEAPASLLVLTKYRGAVTGFFHYEAETYEIEGTEGADLMLFEVDDAALPSERPPVPVGTSGDLTESGDAMAAFDAATPADPIVQDLLVVYTAAAVARAGSVETLESKILSAVAAANAAYTSSAIALQVSVAGLRQVAYTETGDMATSLSRLRNTSDGYLDEVNTWRDQTHADLVSLITDEGNACGIAYVMSPVSASFATSAFSVVNQTCFSNQTLAHELGHNQGNSHDRAHGGASAYPYSFGYRTCDGVAYTNGQSFRTVMGYSCGSAPRVNYFSNPQVFYNGAPMGVAYEVDPANAADNSRSMRNSAATISAFRSRPASQPPSAPTSLTATPSPATVSLAWLDTSTNETGFTVERATGGGSFSTRATLAAGAVTFIDSGLAASATYHYRVRSFNEAGVSAWSAVATANTPAAPTLPASPAPAAVQISGTTAVVSWANVTGESSYRVVRYTFNKRKGTWSSSVISVGANVVSLTQSLSAGTYRYTVSAVNDAGVSAAAIATCATCGADGSFTIVSTKGGGRDKDDAPRGKP